MLKKLAMFTLAAVVLAGGTARAQDKCVAARAKAIGKKESGLLACHAKVAAKGDPSLLSPCVAKVVGKFGAAFAKAGTCSGTLADCESVADDCADEVSFALPDAGPSKCEAARLKAAGKKASALMACYGKVAAKNDGTLFMPCHDKAAAKFSAAYTKVTGCGGDGQEGAVETLVENECASQAVTLDGNGLVTGLCPPQPCKPIVRGQAIPNTYHTTDLVGPGVCILGSAANELRTCQSDGDCGGTGGACVPTPWISAGGITLPFPLGINLTYTVTSAVPPPSCNHPACLSCGNAAALCSGMAGCGGNPPTNPKCVSSTCCDQPALTVPTFFLSALGTCVKVDQKTCGLGVVNSSIPQSGDNEVSKTGDTSDPGPDCTYGTGDDPAPKPCDTSLGGAGSDKAGKVVRTLGNGMPDAAGIQSRFAVPIMATAWTDKPPQTAGAVCPGNDTFDLGEILLTQLILNAELSTAGTTGSFSDLNGDGCSFAGSAFGGGNVGPITLGPPTVHPAPYLGGSNLMSSVGLVFPGTGPLNDLGFIALVPFAQPAVAPSQSCSCTLTPGCPE